MDYSPLNNFFQNNNIVKKNLIKCNDYSSKFGLVLNEKDALTIINSKKDSLREHQRIEFGEGILPKLIFTFCDSPYIYQDNYVETLCALQDIFYLYKNEALDDITDDELVNYMKRSFDGICQGSLDYLEDTCLEKFAKKIRFSHTNFIEYEDTDDEC